MHSLSDGSLIRISLAADEEMVSWQARLVLARELFSRSERVTDAHAHRLHSWQAIDPDGQEDEFGARLLAHCFLIAAQPLFGIRAKGFPYDVLGFLVCRLFRRFGIPGLLIPRSFAHQIIRFQCANRYGRRSRHCVRTENLDSITANALS